MLPVIVMVLPLRAQCPGGRVCRGVAVFAQRSHECGVVGLATEVAADAVDAPAPTTAMAAATVMVNFRIGDSFGRRSRSEPTPPENGMVRPVSVEWNAIDYRRCGRPEVEARGSTS